MTTQKRNSQHVYDYAVIGSGLSGLCIANALNKITSNLVLIEGSETFGGFNRGINSSIGTVNNGLRFLPSTELSQKAISFLETLLSTSFQTKTQEIPPVTYDSTGLKTFVGFGDQSPAFYEELAPFTSAQRLTTNLEPFEWTQMLFHNFTGDFSPKSIVTKVICENGRATGLLVNGQKKIFAQNFIFCGPLSELKLLLPDEALNPKARAKLAKNTYWTAICVDFTHAQDVTDSQAMHVLNGTTQDEVGPSVGLFRTPQYSQWQTFVNSEESQDTEIIGASLKKMKRQIKRAYPEALDNLVSERILVVPQIAGHGDMRLNSNQSLPLLENFWIGTGTMSTQKNLVGTLLQAELICSALGCHPAGHDVKVLPELSENFSQDLEL